MIIISTGAGQVRAYRTAQDAIADGADPHDVKRQWLAAHGIGLTAVRAALDPVQSAQMTDEEILDLLRAPWEASEDGA